MDLISVVKIIEEELIRYNYSHKTPFRLRGFPTGTVDRSQAMWVLFEYVSRVDNFKSEDIVSITATNLTCSLIELSKTLSSTRKDRWNTPSPNVPKFRTDVSKNLKERDLKNALDIIDEELSESGTRCHYMYNLEIKTIEIPPNTLPGFSAEIYSEVYGEINTAMDESLILSIINLSKFLMTTRKERWENE